MKNTGWRKFPNVTWPRSFMKPPLHKAGAKCYFNQTQPSLALCLASQERSNRAPARRARGAAIFCRECRTQPRAERATCSSFLLNWWPLCLEGQNIPGWWTLVNTSLPQTHTGALHTLLGFLVSSHQDCSWSHLTDILICILWRQSMLEKNMLS